MVSSEWRFNLRLTTYDLRLASDNYLAIMRRMNKFLSDAPRALLLGRQVLDIEAAAVQALSARLDDHFLQALDLILRCEGRVIVSGMGK